MAIKDINLRAIPAESTVLFQHTAAGEGIKGKDTLNAALSDLVRKLWEGYAVVQIFGTKLDIARRSSGAMTEYVSFPIDILTMAAMVRFLKDLWPQKKIIDAEMELRVKGLLSEAGTCIVDLDKKCSIICRLPDEVARLERLALLVAMKVGDAKETEAILSRNKPNAYYDMSARFFAQNPDAKAGKTIGTMGLK
jgi:hypothetical protein